MTLLSVRELCTSFFTDEGEVRAVDGVSFDVAAGEVVCLVGESGSGKSAAALSILRLLPDPPGRITGGQILFGDDDLARASEARMRQIRGDRIAMIFQDPMTSLNPYLTVGAQLCEVLALHRGAAPAEANKAAAAMLAEVGIPAPETRLADYPHQLSGGMRQRVMIAMALLCEPDLLIADEPTTALDVTVQAQILDLIVELKEKRGLAVLLITHDLGVVARMADRALVMYAGKLVEQGRAEELLVRPRHPYTAALCRSVPRLDGALDERLYALGGLPPSPHALPPGCPFHPRCDRAVAACRETFPEEVVSERGRLRCHAPIDS
jgi:oligopeptide/dipeptide ABC transporter ATP-binding protein